MESLSAGKLIRLSKSCISDAEKQAVLGVLDREYLGMGLEVQKFENELTDFFGRSAVCVANGTAALQLAIQAAGIGYGDEVIVQSLTYVSSFQAISATGAIPVACDVDLESLTLDYKQAESLITSRTRAVMPVHYAGNVGDLNGIYSFAKRHDLRVIEDAAHAFGSSYRRRRVGGFGDIACFSFDGIKNITSGEGGCVVANDENLLNKIRDARLLGVEQDTNNRYAGKRSWDFDVASQGWRYHMSDIMAAIGSAQLSRSQELFKQRRILAAYYLRCLSSNMKVIPILSDLSEIVPHIFPVRIPDMVDRTLLRERLLEKGIETGVHYKPNHTHSLYASRDSFPITELIYSQLLTLPLHPDISEEEIKFICSTLLEVLQ